MKDEGYLNIALKILKEEINLGTELMSKQFKAVAPFGQRKMTDEDRIHLYDSMDLDEISELRTEFGDEAYTAWSNEIKALRRKVYG